MMWPKVDELLARAPEEGGEQIGRSRRGRAVRGLRYGTGPLRVSLIGGCHADEPVGPWLLRHLAAWLGSADLRSSALTDVTWWICPHANPDGEAANAAWAGERAPDRFDVAEYLAAVVRELPGDDVEFGFPRDEGDGARPETRALVRWWGEDDTPFGLHASLHGMAFAGGPWFLVDAAWRERVKPVLTACSSAVAGLGYALHDIDRGGEKGFHRIARGFCTRPSSIAMREHFLALDDPVTAARFRPSSMETVRRWGGDPLTLVSEMPLFVTPGVGRSPAVDEPERIEWRGRVERWRRLLAGGSGGRPPAAAMEAVRAEARAAGLRAMPVRDQQALQWAFVISGLDLVKN